MLSWEPIRGQLYRNQPMRGQITGGDIQRPGVWPCLRVMSLTLSQSEYSITGSDQSEARLGFSDDFLPTAEDQQTKKSILDSFLHQHVIDP